METLYLTKDVKISREEATLVVAQHGSHQRRRIPIEGLSHIIVAGEAQLTTAVLGLCGRSGVRVTMLDWNGNVTGSFEPRGTPASGRLRVLQASAVTDISRRMEFARSFVNGAGRNILTNLKYRIYRGNNLLKPIHDSIEAILEKVKSSESVESLMGFEGQMRAFYYEAWPLINPGLDFGARRRRPPNNPVNCLISWFNGLAYSLVRNEIAKTHLDDSMAFLHSARAARSSLALDISEIFKPALCDTIIFEIVLRDQMEDTWFHQEEGVCRLSEKGRVATLEMWVQKVEDRSSGDSFRDLVRQEALAIERDLLGIATYKPWKRKV